MKRIREEFIPLPVDRLLELASDWVDGRLDLDLRALPALRGATVKLTVRVPEEQLAEFDREGLRAAVLAAGAAACRAPTVHVIRREERRDARHAAELPLEDSLRIFAEEVRAPDAGERVAFAAALAREADAGVTE